MQRKSSQLQKDNHAGPQVLSLPNMIYNPLAPSRPELQQEYMSIDATQDQRVLCLLPSASIGTCTVICASEQLLNGLPAFSQKTLLKQCATMAACSGQQRLALAEQKLASPALSTIEGSQISGKAKDQEENQPSRICNSRQLLMIHAIHLCGLQASCLRPWRWLQNAGFIRRRGTHLDWA